MKGNIRTNRKGFTLVELVVVIAIVGILATLIIPSLIGYARKAEKKAHIATASLIGKKVTALLAEDPAAYDSFYAPQNHTQHTVTVEGEGSYDVIMACKIDGNRTAKSGCDGVRWRSGITEVDNVFSVAFNKTRDVQGGNKDYIYPMKVVSHTDQPDPAGHSNDKGHTDRWLIVYRCDNKNVEVWAGNSWGQWGNGPAYRLWPAPDPEYAGTR